MLDPTDALEPPERGPGSRDRRRWFLAGSATLVLLALVLFREVLLPFLLGVVVAYVLAPLVQAGERIRLGGRKPPRWAVVLALYTTLIALSVGLAMASAPRLVAELTRLAKEAPRAVAVVRAQWLPELDRHLRTATAQYLARREGPPDGAMPGSAVPLPAESAGTAPPPAGIQVRPSPGGGYDVLLPPQGLRVVPEGERAFRIEVARARAPAETDLASVITEAVSRQMRDTEQTAVTVLRTASTVVGTLTRGVFAFFVTLMISVFLLVTSGRIFDFFRSLYSPGKQGNFDDLVHRIDRGLAGVVRGQIIICCVNGLLTGVGFYLLSGLGLKYWVFLTVVATVMSIIPIFGVILSTIPAVIVALPEGPGLALLVLGWIVVIHQIEANVLNPKIMGDSARVHPVLVVFALIGGEHLWGIVGALLAVPVLSITQTSFLYLREKALGVPRTSSLPSSSPRATPTPAVAPDDTVGAQGSASVATER